MDEKALKKLRRLSAEYTGHDKRERRLSTDDNTEITELFKGKMELTNAVKKYLNLKVQYQLKRLEEKISLDLVNSLIDNIDLETSKIINKLNHKKEI